MKTKIKIAVILIFLCGGTFVFTHIGQMQTAQAQKTDQVKTAGEVYKNIQVLKDIPADQWDNVMAIFTGSLGVKCNFCHIPGQWEKDDKREKKKAREMIKMLRGINRDNFEGQPGISCATCHGGKTKPSLIPPLGQNAFQRQPRNSRETDETLPKVDEILNRYIAALGGKAAIEKVSTRILKGSRIGADGVPVPEEVYEKMPDKMLVITTYPQIAFNTAFNGSDVWSVNSKGEPGNMSADEAEQFKREAQLLNPTKLQEIYQEMSVVGKDNVNDQEVYLVQAVTPAGGRERLYFDIRTGLLVRRYSAFPTAVGMFPFQVDYSDFKAFDGVQIPTTLQWSIPGRVWGRKITEVIQNTAIGDAKFDPPGK